MKKKTISCICGVMLALLLTGCSSKNDESTGDTNENGQVVVKIGKETGQDKFPEGDNYENNAYSRALEDKLNIDLQDAFEAQGEDYSRQVALAISSGEIPDLMKVSIEEFRDLYKNDMLADLTDVYDKYASGYIKDIYKSYSVDPLADVTMDGKLYAIPHVVELTAPQMVWVRADWLEKLNIDVLDKDTLTVDELKNIATKFVTENPKGVDKPVGIAFTPNVASPTYDGALIANPILNAFGSFPKTILETADGSVTNGSITEETKAGLGELHEWFKEGILDPQFGTRTWDDIMALAINGESGIFTGNWHFPSWGLANVREMDPEAEFKPFAIVDEKNKVNIATMNPRGQVLVASKNFKHPEKLIEMVNFIYDDLPNAKDVEHDYPEIYNYMKLGLEGSTRPFNVEIQTASKELDDFGSVIDVINGDKNYDELTTVKTKKIADQIQNYVDNPSAATTAEWGDYHNTMRGINLALTLKKDDVFNWVMPAYFGTNAATEQYGGNLNTLEETEFIKIITGEVPLDHFDQFVKDWHKQGGDEVLKAIEKDLDEK